MKAGRSIRSLSLQSRREKGSLDQGSSSKEDKEVSFNIYSEVEPKKEFVKKGVKALNNHKNSRKPNLISRDYSDNTVKSFQLSKKESREILLKSTMYLLLYFDHLKKKKWIFANWREFTFTNEILILWLTGLKRKFYSSSMT